jgi:transposase, IS6 family
MSLVCSISGLFKWRQFEPEVILLAVGWYLRFSLSYRDVEELLAERGILVDHVTLWRWVQRYAPEMERRLRKRLKATNDSWRVDETYVRVKGQWRYLYRAVDSSGATLDFLLSAKQDAEAAKRFLTKALGRENHPEPRVVHTDGHAAYPPAIAQLKEEGALDENCRHRVGRYLNNVVEQDHRAIKRRVKASQHFRSFWAAWRTLAGYEALHTKRHLTLQFKPRECGHRTQSLRLIPKLTQARDQRRLDLLERLEGTVSQGLLAQIVPEVLHRVKFRTMGGLVEQTHVVGHLQRGALVPAGPIGLQHDQAVGELAG